MDRTYQIHAVFLTNLDIKNEQCSFANRVMPGFKGFLFFVDLVFSI